MRSLGNGRILGVRDANFQVGQVSLYRENLGNLKVDVLVGGVRGGAAGKLLRFGQPGHLPLFGVVPGQFGAWKSSCSSCVYMGELEQVESWRGDDRQQLRAGAKQAADRQGRHCGVCVRAERLEAAARCPVRTFGKMMGGRRGRSAFRLLRWLTRHGVRPYDSDVLCGAVMGNVVGLPRCRATWPS